MPYRNYPSWTDAEYASLLELAAAGLSARTIAAELTFRHSRPFTRNAIIGKVHRLNAFASDDDLIILRGVGGGQHSQKRKPAIKQAEAKPRMSEPKLTIPQALKIVALPPGEPEPLEHVDFFGVALPPDDGECHYVHGDPKLKTHRYCRHPALRLGPETFGAYCPYHTAVVHRDERQRDLSVVLGLE